MLSASSSGISMPNSSSHAITSSTRSSESAPRSSVKLAAAVTSSASTPNCSTMMLLTFSATAIGLPPIGASFSGRFLAQSCNCGRETGRSSLHVHAARDVEHVAGDVGGLVGGEVQHGCCHVVDGAQAVQRDHRLELLAALLGLHVGHGVDAVVRRHYVDRDAAAADLARQRLG